MVTRLPVIAVDDREKDAEFLRALDEYFTCKRKHLPCGDYMWSCPLGIVGVERKSMADLCGSRNNKRLDDELRRLVEMYPLPVLFITGRDPPANEYSHWDYEAIENLKLGRQLHGVYVYHVGKEAINAAYGLHRLWTYTQERLGGATDGVRRERRFTFWGPLGARAEAIYGILGGAQGIRSRRSVAESIASTTPISEFMKWTQTDFSAAGFSSHMATKLATHLHNMEAPIGSS